MKSRGIVGSSERKKRQRDRKGSMGTEEGKDRSITRATRRLLGRFSKLFQKFSLRVLLHSSDAFRKLEIGQTLALEFSASVQAEPRAPRVSDNRGTRGHGNNDFVSKFGRSEERHSLPPPLFVFYDLTFARYIHMACVCVYIVGNKSVRTLTFVIFYERVYT